METVLITGADRGIGAALARQYRDRGDRTIAACLGDGANLVAEGFEVAPNVDVTDMASLSGLAERLQDTTITILVSNAGAFAPERWREFDYAGMLHVYDVNALGPLRVVDALMPRLAAGSKIGIITSRVGEQQRRPLRLPNVEMRREYARHQPVPRTAAAWHRGHVIAPGSGCDRNDARRVRGRGFHYAGNVRGRPDRATRCPALGYAAGVSSQRRYVVAVVMRFVRATWGPVRTEFSARESPYADESAASVQAWRNPRPAHQHVIAIAQHTNVNACRGNVVSS